MTASGPVAPSGNKHCTSDGFAAWVGGVANAERWDESDAAGPRDGPAACADIADADL